MHYRLLLIALVLGSTIVAQGCAPAVIPDVAVKSFVDAAALRPEYVGSGLIDHDTLLVVTVTGNDGLFRALAQQHLPPGTRFEIRVVQHGLAELRALAQRITLAELSPPNPNPDITFVDVDELRGLVVIGVSRIDDSVVQVYKDRYAPLVVVEQQQGGSLFSSP